MSYENEWTNLNIKLREIERFHGGLSAALSELEIHQRNNGFIKDSLEGIERVVFCHPLEKNHTLRAQINPRRAKRHFGSSDQKKREEAITRHRIMARLVKRLLHYKNTPGWQSNSLLFKPLPTYTPPPTGLALYGSANRKQEDQGTPLLDQSSEVQQPRGESSYRGGNM